MIKSVYLLIFSLWSVQLLGQMSYGKYAYQNKTSYILQSTEVKKEPVSEAKSIAYLQTGTKIRVDGISHSEYSKNGYITNWYQISFAQNDNVTKVGYIWGGALSTIALPFQTFSSKKNLFLFGITAFDEKSGFTATIKVIREGQEIAQATMPAISFSEDGHYEYCIDGKIIGKRGFSKLHSIFEVSSTYAACGYPNVSTLIFWNGRELKIGAQGMEMLEAGHSSVSTKVIFPDQAEGKPNQLRLIETHEKYYEDAVINREVIEKKLHWNGTNME